MNAPWYSASWPGWHYPDPNHPCTREFPSWAKARRRRCLVCGAPENARCVTKRGATCNNHGNRGWPLQLENVR
jgi:hypothetical protein